MVSVAWLNEDGAIEVSRWTPAMKKRAKQAAMQVLAGVGMESTDTPESGRTVIAVRRQCTDDERRMVLEKYLETK